MKIYLSNINESWIIDRIRSDWYKYNKTSSTKFIMISDMVWIVSPWTLKKKNLIFLKNKKVICSIYHIDFENFDKEKFQILDTYVHTYHVISLNTKKDLSRLTSKKIVSIPFWIDNNIWFEIKNKSNIRTNYGFNSDDYLVGSFQRDSEGNDLTKPKLIKGPDIFIKNILQISKLKKNLVVILTGKRRNYIINELKINNIKFKYFEMVNEKILNELYNILDLYIVSSRLEGGPQAILECALVKTPIVSTNVGVAPEILSPESIYNLDNFQYATPNLDYAFNKVQEYILPNGMEKFRNLFSEVYES